MSSNQGHILKNVVQIECADGLNVVVGVDGRITGAYDYVLRADPSGKNGYLELRSQKYAYEQVWSHKALKFCHALGDRGVLAQKVIKDARKLRSGKDFDSTQKLVHAIEGAFATDLPLQLDTATCSVLCIATGNSRISFECADACGERVDVYQHGGTILTAPDIRAVIH